MTAQERALGLLAEQEMSTTEFCKTMWPTRSALNIEEARQWGGRFLGRLRKLGLIEARYESSKGIRMWFVA